MAKRKRNPKESPTETIRRLVNAAESMTALANGADVNRQNLYLFAQGKGIEGKTLDKLAAWFGLVLRG